MAEKDEVAEEVSGLLNKEIRAYYDARSHYEEKDKERNVAKKKYEDARDRLWDLLESAGVKTINHDLGRFTRTNRVIATVNDKEALTQWLDDHGMLEAFTRTEFRQAQMNGLAKEAVENGDDLPDGMDVLTPKSITLTK